MTARRSNGPAVGEAPIAGPFYFSNIRREATRDSVRRRDEHVRVTYGPPDSSALEDASIDTVVQARTNAVDIGTRLYSRDLPSSHARSQGDPGAGHE